MHRNIVLLIIFLFIFFAGSSNYKTTDIKSTFQNKQSIRYIENNVCYQHFSVDSYEKKFLRTIEKMIIFGGVLK